MSTVDLIGWLATVAGTILGLPQLVRLVRTRSIEGLSLIGWQAMLAVFLGWTAHGIKIGQLPQIVTSVVSLATAIPILYLMSRGLGRRFVPILLPGLALAAGMIAVDQLLGSAAFGVVAIIPAVLANAGQSIELVRASHVSGVSMLFLILAVVNQALWLTWALLVPDAATVIAATTTGTIVAFNLTWYTLRRFGLRAFFEHDSTRQAVPAIGHPETG
jgi:uncharacterized protein with PQ loop repeat